MEFERLNSTTTTVESLFVTETKIISSRPLSLLTRILPPSKTKFIISPHDRSRPRLKAFLQQLTQIELVKRIIKYIFIEAESLDNNFSPLPSAIKRTVHETDDQIIVTIDGYEHIDELRLKQINEYVTKHLVSYLCTYTIDHANCLVSFTIIKKNTLH